MSNDHHVGEFALQYEVFVATVAQLSAAYTELTGRFQSLQDELADANAKLRVALEERNRSATYLEDIMGSVPSGVVTVDLEGRVQLYNAAAEKLFGRPAAQVVGRAYRDVLPELEPSACTALRTTRSGAAGEKRLPDGTGKTVPVTVATELLTDKEGVVYGAVEIVSDLSRLRHLEGELARIRMLAGLGEMAATVAHEIRNPLSGIAGFAGLLARDFQQGDERRRLADNVVKGCDNLNRIVTNLLRYAQPLRLECRAFDVCSELVEELALVEQTLLREQRRVTIRRALPEKALRVEADPTQIRMAVHNLLLNAADATGSGHVECGLDAPGDRRLRIWVSDDGPGVSGAHLDKIFNPFFTTKDKGTGLGLATVRKVMEAHGGSVEYVPAPSGGARFELHLPLGMKR